MFISKIIEWWQRPIEDVTLPQLYVADPGEMEMSDREFIRKMLEGKDIRIIFGRSRPETLETSVLRSICKHEYKLIKRRQK